MPDMPDPTAPAPAWGFQPPHDPNDIDHDRIRVKPPDAVRARRMAGTHPEWLPDGPWSLQREDPYGRLLRDRLTAIAGAAADVWPMDPDTKPMLDHGVVFYPDKTLHIPIETQDTSRHCFIVRQANPGTYTLDGYALDQYGTWHRQQIPLIPDSGRTGAHLAVETRTRRAALYYGVMKAPDNERILESQEVIQHA